jgi:hypothetical protein
LDQPDVDRVVFNQQDIDKMVVHGDSLLRQSAPVATLPNSFYAPAAEFSKKQSCKSNGRMALRRQPAPALKHGTVKLIPAVKNYATVDGHRIARSRTCRRSSKITP